MATARWSAIVRDRELARERGWLFCADRRNLVWTFRVRCCGDTMESSTQHVVSRTARKHTRAALHISVDKPISVDPSHAQALTDFLAAALQTEQMRQSIDLQGLLMARRKERRGSTLYLDLVAGDAASVQLIVQGDDLEAVRKLTLGSLLRVVGEVAISRSHGRLSLHVPPHGIELVQNFAGDATQLRACHACPPRFHMVPSTVRWQSALDKLGIGAFNTLAWRGGEPVPLPPARGPDTRACWLLPASDPAALAIAEQQASLRRAGWRLLTCGVNIVWRLNNKVQLRGHAEQLGLLESLPRHFATPEGAEYPCVLKSAEGVAGHGVYIVRSLDEARRRTGQCAQGSGGAHRHDANRADASTRQVEPSMEAEATAYPTALVGLGERWLLQELVLGAVECSASMLVVRGCIRRVAVVEYTYDAEAYVWPQCKERKELRRWHGVLAPAHHRLLEALLIGYSGVINANYKVRADGRLALFEFNTRVGGDLAVDLSRAEAAAFFEALDELDELDETPDEQPGAQSSRVHRSEGNASGACSTSPECSSPAALPTTPLATPLRAPAPPPATLMPPTTPTPLATPAPPAASTPPTPPTPPITPTPPTTPAPPITPTPPAAPEATLVYLSQECDESPRYATPAQAPGWLRADVREGSRCFLLRGAHSPALAVLTPEDLVPSGRSDRDVATPPAADSRALEATGDEETSPADEEPPAGRPAVLVVPGGGYTTLAPHEGLPAARWLASLGAVACTLRYRLPATHAWPAARDDLEAALTFLRSAEARHRWRIDTLRIGVCGFSAGAHLVAQAASAALRAAVLIYPPVVDTPAMVPTVCPGLATKVAAAASAADRFTAFYVVGSTNDRVVPVESHADVVVDALRASGVVTVDARN